MQLARFLNTVFKKDGFILVDADSKNYMIGRPKYNTPIKVKILVLKRSQLDHQKRLVQVKQINHILNQIL